MMHLVGVQVNNVNALSLHDISLNLAHSSQIIRRHYETNFAKLNHPNVMYVLPECSSVGYDDATFERANIVAERLEPGGLSYDAYSTLAVSLRVFICFGFIRKNENNNLHVCQAVFNNEGKLVASYDKIHLCQFGACREKDFFTAGSIEQKFHVFDCYDFRCGLAICFDLRFPELFRKLALDHNVDLVIHSSAFPKDGKSADWHSFVITRAIENQIYVLTTNRAGKGFGQSIFCPPWMNDELKYKSLGDDEDLLDCIIEKKVINDIRNSIPYRN
jgi:predicted amidohydrolase